MAEPNQNNVLETNPQDVSPYHAGSSNINCDTATAPSNPDMTVHVDENSASEQVVSAMHTNSPEQYNNNCKDGKLNGNQVLVNWPQYEARSAFKGGYSGETDLKEAEIVAVLEKTGTGWWKVHSSAGVGWVPSHFLRLPLNSPSTAPTAANLPDDVHEETAPRKYLPKIPIDKESIKLKGHIAFRYLQFAHGSIDDPDCFGLKPEKRQLQLEELFKTPPAGTPSKPCIADTQIRSTPTPTTVQKPPSCTLKPTLAKKPVSSTLKPASAEKSTNCTTKPTATEKLMPSALKSTIEKPTIPTLRYPTSKPATADKLTIHSTKPMPSDRLINLTAKHTLPAKPTGHSAKPNIAEKPLGFSIMPTVTGRQTDHSAKPTIAVKPLNRTCQPVTCQKPVKNQPSAVDTPQSLKSVSDLRAMFNRV